jgi:hypothetical protein
VSRSFGLLLLLAGSACRTSDAQSEPPREAPASGSAAPLATTPADAADQRLSDTLVTMRTIVTVANDSKDPCETAKREASSQTDGWKQPLEVSCPGNLPRVCSAGPDGAIATKDDICDDVRNLRRPIR